MKYPVGTKLIVNNIYGVVVENVKFPDDICVMWDEVDYIYSYDEEWLDEHALIIKG